MTRRSFLALLGAVSEAAPAGLADARRVSERVYRADAVITFLGLPIFSRSGVGSGYASVEDFRNAPEKRLILRFAAGSWPHRAAGLNRLGCIEERVTEDGAGVRAAEYLGFMTSSREDSLAEARKAIASRPGTMPITAIRGVAGTAGAQAAITRLEVSNTSSWANWEPLLLSVREAFGSIHLGGPARSAPTASFLHSLAEMIAAGGKTASRSFTYGSKLYDLTTEKRPDARTGQSLARKQLTAQPGNIMLLSGTIRERGAGKDTRFRLWFDSTNPSPLPLRFALQPRSFLSLVFEADPSLPRFAFPDLLPKK